MSSSFTPHNKCLQCQRFEATRSALHFCCADCALEWAAQRSGEATPQQVREIVALAQRVTFAHQDHRSIHLGQLTQLVRSIWPEVTQPKK